MTVSPKALQRQNSRYSVLMKMGLTEDDIQTSDMLFKQMPPPPSPSGHNGSKQERVLGYSKLRLKRSKALRVLGASEEELDKENRKNLGSLGVGGRRRSFIVEDQDNEGREERFEQPWSGLVPYNLSSSAEVAVRVVASTKSPRKRSRGLSVTGMDEIKGVRRELGEAKVEISQLKERIRILETNNAAM